MPGSRTGPASWRSSTSSGGGCQSELEIWRHLQVSQHPSMPETRRQPPVWIAGGLLYIEAWAETLAVVARRRMLGSA